MKAISLWQPWASAVATGAKRIETRHWATDYRGPLAIHAAKRRPVYELIGYSSDGSWRAAFAHLLKEQATFLDVLPFGAIVATCELVDCRPTETFSLAELETPRTRDLKTGAVYDIVYRHPDAGPAVGVWTERQMGNFALGRFGWRLEAIRPLENPVPCVGRQGIFDWSPHA